MTIRPAAITIPTTFLAIIAFLFCFPTICFDSFCLTFLYFSRLLGDSEDASEGGSEAADEKSIISLQSLIEQPAVVFADEVWLPDEGMRTLYVEWLCKLGGNGVRALCEKRFVVESEAVF